jgi:hypothetical protein
MTDHSSSSQNSRKGQKNQGAKGKAGVFAQKIKERIIMSPEQVNVLFDPILESYRKAGLKISLETEASLRAQFQEVINDFSSTPLSSTRKEQAQQLLDERLKTLLQHQKELETAVEKALAEQLARLLPQVKNANDQAALATRAAAEAAQEARDAKTRAEREAVARAAAEQQIARQAHQISAQHIALQNAESGIREAGHVINSMLNEQNKKTIKPPIRTKAVSDAIAAASKILVELNRSDKAPNHGKSQNPTKTKTITANSPAYKNFAKLMGTLTTQNEKDQVIAHIQSSLVRAPQDSSSKGRDNQKVFLNLVKSQFANKSISTLVSEWKNVDKLKKTYLNTNRNVIPTLPKFLPSKGEEAISEKRLAQLRRLGGAAAVAAHQKDPKEAARAMFTVIGQIQAELKQEHNYLGSKLDKMLIKMEADLKKGLLPAALTANEIKVAKDHGAAQAVTEKAGKKASHK